VQSLKGLRAAVGDPTRDELWARLEKNAAFKKSAVEAMKMAYGALTGSTYRLYEGRGGPQACMKAATEALKAVLKDARVTPHQISIEAQIKDAKFGEDRILTMKEVSAYLGMTPAGLSRRIKQGKDHPPYFMMGGNHYRFRKVEVLRWLNNIQTSARFGQGSRRKK
jgi:predicted DNA-binding transcriptional regulator AlpA